MPSTSRSSADPNTSITRFTTRAGPLNRGCSTRSKTIPRTGSTDTRGPATSTSAGEINSDRSDRSIAHANSRETFGSPCAPGT